MIFGTNYGLNEKDGLIQLELSSGNLVTKRSINGRCFKIDKKTIIKFSK